MNTYDFEAKRKYRFKLWAEVDKRIAKPRAMRRVVYLDTSEALETMHLLKLGYSADNMLAVNRNPAHVAAITHRLKREGLPRIHTSGRDWLAAIGRFGGLDVANFDGMGCLSYGLCQLVRETVSIARPRVLAVNMLAGREDVEFSNWISIASSNFKGPGEGDYVRTTYGKSVSSRHINRIRLLLSAALEFDLPRCHLHVKSVGWDVYVSESNQPMVWAVADFVKHENDLSLQKRSFHIMPTCVFSGRIPELCKDKLGAVKKFLSEQGIPSSIYCKHLKDISNSDPLSNERGLRAVAVRMGWAESWRAVP